MIESFNEEKGLLGIFVIDNATIKVVQIDITTLSVDVIVNAANERLQHLGGVAGAINDKGGASIQRECNEYVYENGSVLEGDCMMSNSGNLPCMKIVHAVGPRWKFGKSKEDKKLAEVILRILEMVMSQGFKSVAIPAISTGIFGYPLHAATDIIVQSIANHFKKVKRSSITTIYLIDINDKSLHSFIRSLQSSVDFKQAEFDDQPRYGTQPRFQSQISETEYEGKPYHNILINFT
ncbi:hypothetical protein LOTGIDRAFT_117468 [Lottia gigantea]|uniref:Macro domain-containing protein n=1 Tax=Lottia gigantea TaxID=225164 RepID=V4AE36_LOTGI|nr:hypothetical protein LOTGIDRAFT_117468 [Lottia gigantea]ESO95137.1 hypothetical protein LOTGIDRAFT_117468 [Lottia gigantea]